MKIILSILIVVASLSNGHCQHTKKLTDTSLLVKYGLSSALVKDWLADSNGCKNLRYKIEDKVRANSKLIGISYEDFLTVFGRPNQEDNNYDFHTLRYFVKNICSEKGVILYASEQNVTLHFRFKNNYLSYIFYSLG